MTKHILAVTACPTGIAHTFMAAENLEKGAKELGYEISVETHGSIGVENEFTAEQLEQADAVVIAADTQIDTSRFAGIPLVSASVASGIKDPKGLIRRALESAPSAGERHAGADATSGRTDASAGRPGVMQVALKALLSGVSHMIPFVVVGGLLIALALSLGGETTAEGIQVAEGTFWGHLNALGGLSFSLMVPILSAYIAYAIADRPGLAPGMVTGMVAVTGELYGSEAGAGFLGGILTGFLSGVVALGIKKIKVHKYIAPIMPIIIIPILTTVIVGLFFIVVIGGPVAGLFAFLTEWLSGMQGTSAIVLGLILGAMVASDMGGPINKTAVLFGGGLIATGNAGPMGMVAAAIAVPPLGVGLATILGRSVFTKPEKDSGIAALFMGFFGITEGAIPLAAARPLQVIPANILGGAVAGGLAGVLGVGDHVMHGGPIVAVLGAVDNVLGFFLSLAVGLVVTAGVALLLIRLSGRGREQAAATPEAPEAPVAEDPEPATATSRTIALREYMKPEAVLLDADGLDRDALIRRLAECGVGTGQIGDVDDVVTSALAREAKGTTGVGDGIAIPHAKTAGVTEPFIAFARVPAGVEWNALDGEPVTTIFLIGVPEAQAGSEHLRILSALSRALLRKPVRAALDEATTPEDVIDALEGPIARR